MSRPSLVSLLLKGKAPLRLVSSSPSTSLRLVRAASSSTAAPSSPEGVHLPDPRKRVIVPRRADEAIPAANPSSHYVPARPKVWSHPVRLNVGAQDAPLPKLTTQRNQLIAVVLISVTLWCAFLVHVMNEEKLTSSVFRQVMYVLRTSPKVEEILGEGIRLESTWWTGGDPYIEGAINVLKGKADLSFRIKGINNAGRIYFTSIRPNKDAAFQVIRFKIITDDGESTELVEEMRGKGYDVDLSQGIERLALIGEKPIGE